MPGLPVASKSYLLKSMVIMRLLAELTAMLILAVMPIFLLISGNFWQLHFYLQVTLCVLALPALGLAISYGYLPFRVVVDDFGLETVALFKRQKLLWQQMQTIKLKTNWGWRRYVIASDCGDVSFPFWLKDVQFLIETIRSRLPARGRSLVATRQSYRLDWASALLQLGKGLAQLVFIVVFWLFFQSLCRGQTANREDIIIVLIAGIVFTFMMLWRFLAILALPHFVEVSSEELLVKSWLKSHQIKWHEIGSITTPHFIFPEGIVLRAGNKRILVGSALDSFDELVEEVRGRSGIKA